MKSNKNSALLKVLATYLSLTVVILISSCETENERKARIESIEKQRSEIREKYKAEKQIRDKQYEDERIEKEAPLEKEKLEKEAYDKYINNSLQNGSTPYAYCFGVNKSCSSDGCSQVKVKTPINSDVIVIIKKNSVVVRHAYISASNSYTFEMPNGTYQVFFYYGIGWNPTKFMKNTTCGELKGGFASDELFGKDDPQLLNNNILEYELILQKNGNFSTKESNLNEAL